MQSDPNLPGTVTTESPADETPSTPVRPWPLSRIQTIALIAVVAPFVVGLSVFGHFYFKYARLIDEKLAAGPFSNSFNIFAAPQSITVGDDLNRLDLEKELRNASYTESPSGQPGTYRTAADSLTVTPPNGKACQIQWAAGKISRLVDVSSRAPVTEYRLPAPLMVNMSMNREKRQIVGFADIPKVLVNAVVSIEDKRFFQHDGVDVLRLVKAAYVDVKDGRKEQGASTLSMQLARGLWLDPQKNWKRKAAEAMITLHLENKLSKEKIFEYYANQVFLGRRGTYSIHGFGEGARAFFDKELGQLTLPEAAMLAGIVQRPSYFNPFRNPDRTLDRRNVVLTMMRQNRYITEVQYQAAVAAPLGLAKQIRESENDLAYFLDLVNEELQSRPEIHDHANYIYTTLDLNLQRAAVQAVRDGMLEVDKRLGKRAREGAPPQAALIAIDPHTGAIKALVGGRDYGTSQLDRVLAKRPPGSVFKPFVYAAALESAVVGGSQVFTPASIVVDEPTTFWFNNKSYEPGNFHEAFYGPVTLRNALAHSMNVATVKLAQAVGFDKVVQLARRAGLNEDIGATPAMALGSYDATPLEMAGAYTVFADNGRYVKPSLVAKAESRDGNIVYQHEVQDRQVLDPRVAYLMVNMLEEVMRTGTAAGVRSRGFTLPAAGKTGTSHDGWFAGFTSKLLCVVWIGFDDYRELNLEGAKSALPVWAEFMKKAARYPEYRDAKEFPVPQGISRTRICADSGKPASSFCETVRTEYFVPGTEPQGRCPIHDAPEPNFSVVQTSLPQTTGLQ